MVSGLLDAILGGLRVAPGRLFGGREAQLGRSWVVLGDLGGLSGGTKGLWSSSLLGFGGLNMQNGHFRKSAPGVGGGTILVVLEGWWGLLGRSLVVLGGSWRLLGRSWVAA